MRASSDFRSDTVTRPDAAMRQAMVEAPVGDDVFGDDPTVRDLEARAARLLGQDAALFLPSGTMANQVAMRVHTRPGDEVILHEGAHVYRFEQGGLAALHGIQAVPLPGEGGQMALEAIEGAIRGDDPHLPRTRVVAVENTHNLAGGRVLPVEHLAAVRALCDRRGLAFHLDGARLANAAVAAGRPLADFGGLVDSVTLCLSKGLGAPAGTVLAGAEPFIRAAHRTRKLLGGGMRQVGILAAAGILAMEEGYLRLEADHRRAAHLASSLSAIDGVTVTPPETNIVLVTVHGVLPTDLCQALEAHGVRAVPFGPGSIRLTLHHQLGDEDVDRAIEAIRVIARDGVAKATGEPSS